MSGPLFASPDRVSRAAHRVQTLVEIMRDRRLEFLAIEDAADIFGRWVKAYHRQELDPEDDDEDWAVDWEHPNEEKDVGTLLALALGEMNAGEELSDTTTCLWAFISGSQTLTSR